MCTTGHGVAEVRGARVGIVTVNGPGADATAADALVAGGARVKVIAGLAVVGVLAAQEGVAGVVGAAIGVVTVEGNPSAAVPIFTLVPEGAYAAVIAGGFVGSVLATGIGVTPVVGAGSRVVAVQESVWGTLAGRARLT